MKPDERAISYAHYEDLRSESVTGVFLTDERLYVLRHNPVLDEYDPVASIPLEDVAMAGPVRGRVVGRQGAWALTRIVRPDNPEDGWLAPGWTWVFIPRRSVMARRVSKLFLQAVKSGLGGSRWVDEVNLNRGARKRQGDFLYETREQACAVSPEMARLGAAVELERAELEDLRQKAGIVGDYGRLQEECDARGAHVPGPPSPSGWIGCSHCGVLIQRPSWWPDKARQ
jgi:hypothetical protein